MKNKIQLCTYADRFGGKGISIVNELVKNSVSGAFGGVHLLPFYYPIDGADAGFDPVDHTQVDEKVGDWSDVTRLSSTHDIMADVIVNHMSAQSKEFADFLANGDASQYSDLFLTFESVFPDGATEQQLVDLYRPRPGLPFTKVKFADGKERMLWTTFTADQVDIDVNSESGARYLTNILDRLQSSNVGMIRLDAAGYAIKKAGTRCFMTDETFAFIDEFTGQAHARNMEVLVEIHAHYLTQVAIAKKSDWVYDFALPPLVLHTLIFGDSAPLQNWFKVSPRNAVTVLDTHDGIGIIDVAAEKNVGPGLLSDSQVDSLVEAIHENSNGNSRKATGAAASNVDLYQVNCTYYDALGADDQKYLMARLIQFFAPGIPQVYYVGLLAGENDMELLSATGVGRDINRRYYSVEDVQQQLQRPVVRNLLGLMRFRNEHPAFAGEFSCESTEPNRLKIHWNQSEASLALTVDLAKMTFEVVSLRDEQETVICDWHSFSD
ncbi:sucrose phosphorylase [Gilvimarinus sp. SDUM040013]|uniref:Sucrose phosphorylase n=1 Tax=Gilvimarinus gilvus TaxID=3058038 RepID=A0ABU4S075_9GAMM|nr:sucrose phosphorylase [Gilvimarinus sp. SDUM040013]MDO3386184.1 sucrose phosphorylase [Gilvimarinus sp. SDUM040013]MDX6849821.1 sucrose phosphorylase [Gilvimarinus sp. SDUM040013]